MEDIVQLPLTHNQLLYVLALSQAFVAEYNNDHTIAEENAVGALRRMMAEGPDGMTALHEKIRLLHDAICPAKLERI